MSLSKSVHQLEDYRTREKLLRTAQYGLQLLSPCVSSKREAFVNVSSKISISRIILRFFDDCSSLYNTYQYGFGRHEESFFLRILTVVENLAGLFYLPVEHFAFAQDVRLFSGSSAKAWRINIILWAVSLITAITKSLIRKRKILHEMEELEKKNSRRDLESESWLQVMYSADLLIALNFLSLLPFGIRLAPWKVGLFGSISSLIGLMRLLKSKR